MNQQKPDRIWESTGFKSNKDGGEYTTWASHPRNAKHPCKCGVYCQTVERLDAHQEKCLEVAA